MAKGRRSRRAGSLAGLVSQAVVPFGLVALNQTYRKKHGGKRSRKHRGGRRSRRH